MPPPTISIFFGNWRSSSAPVESTMRGSSGRNGSRMACEPAAMMHCLKRMVCFLPVLSCPLPLVSSTST